MDQTKIAQAFAFDQHFRQFGTVNVVPYKLKIRNSYFKSV